uniref:FBA_2 domain-containing protein n=1 Tax=Caenorhabditis tropicalis TaxID=1561998 RepID=A0A1I7U6G1_9PELO
MTSPSYLFRLPQLVYSIIINSMTMTEQILISLCSSKTYSTVKSVRRKTVKIALNIRNNQFVTVVVDGSNEYLRFGQMLKPDDWPMNKKIIINGNPILFEYGLEACMLGTVWDDIETGTKEIIRYFDELLGAKVQIVEISDESGGPIMNWLQRRQGELILVEIFSREDTVFDVDALQNIIKDCEAKYISLKVKTGGKPFQIQNSHGKCEFFSCELESDFRVDNIMQIDAPEIFINNRWYKGAEIDRFVRNWMNGGNPHLKAIHFTSVAYDNQHISYQAQGQTCAIWAQGIGALWKPEKRHFRSVIAPRKSFSFNGGYEIERNDGTKALFDCSEDYFSFALETSLD